MSIHFISGKPGGGKTLYGVRLILDELLHGNRVIITNCPINLSRLNEYLQQRYPVYFRRAFEFDLAGKTIGDLMEARLEQAQTSTKHISERVILLNEDDLSKFFTFRPNNVRLASVSNAEWKAGKRPDFSGVTDGGVLYVLDEVHIAFNARAWAETGHEVLYYLSQHRKLGDDVVCITQSIGNVDKQFRSVAQDFTYIRNLSKQRAGLFRLPAMFIRSTYAQPATDNSKAMETGSFTLDVSGIASCYDTAKGVGIHGRAGADTKSRKKGIHWLWFVILCPVLIWLISQYLPVWTAHMITPKNQKKQQAPVSPAPPSPAAVNSSKPLQTVAENNSGTVYEEPELYCTGYYILKGKPYVALSDGSIRESDEVTQITKRTVTVNGRILQIRTPRQTSTEQPPVMMSPAPPIAFQPPAPAPVAFQPSSTVDVTYIGKPRHSEPMKHSNGMSSMQRNSPQGNSGW